MKCIIFSDVHGDSLALEQFEQKISNYDYDQLICLGDITDKDTLDLGVIDRLSSLGVTGVIGNHDFDLIDELTDKQKSYLLSLPQELSIGGLYFTHISPIGNKKIRGVLEAEEVFMNSELPLIFVGHNHFHHLISCDSTGVTKEVELALNKEFVLDLNKKYLVCVGALADYHEPPAPKVFVVFDTDKSSIEFVEIG